MLRDRNNLRLYLPNARIILGEVCRITEGPYIPPGFIPAEGQNELISDYPELFELLKQHVNSQYTDTHFTIPNFGKHTIIKAKEITHD